MRHRFRRTPLAAALLAVLLAMGGAQSASADSWQGCGTGTVCEYSGSSGQGTVRAYLPGEDGQSYGSGWDNATVSVWNNSGYWACLYEDAAYGGSIQALHPGWRGDLVKTTVDLTGKLSSHKLAKSKAGCWTGYERCPDGSLCLFQGPSGRGAYTAYTADSPGYAAADDNTALSVANTTDLHVCLYSDAGYAGNWVVDGRAYKAYVILRGDYATIPAPFAHSFSAHKLVTGTSAC